MADDKTWTKDKISSCIDGNELDLSLREITKVPVKLLLPFTKVTVLDLSCNRIHILPETFTKLTQLVQLDLSKNCLTELPHDFGVLSKLKKLDLLENHISKIPLSFRLLNNLAWLDLKGNPIQESFPKLVGDCLKPSECQQCAKNIVRYSQALYEEELEKERKRKKKEEEKLAKQAREEDALRRRRKEEKKRRNAERKIAQEKTEHHGEKSTKDESDKASLENSDDVKSLSRGRFFTCSRFLLFLLFATLVIFAVFVIHFNGDVAAFKKTGLELIDSMEFHIKRLLYSDKVK